MTTKEQLPEIAICHVCKQPMKVVDVSALAESMGYKVTEGSYALECCGFEEHIDDPELAREVIALLVNYHESVKQENKS